MYSVGVKVRVINVTFKNILVISWRSIFEVLGWGGWNLIIIIMFFI